MNRRVSGDGQMPRTVYRQLIVDLCACEAWGDAARKDGFLERAAEYYGDAAEAAYPRKMGRGTARVDQAPTAAAVGLMHWVAQ